MLKNYIILALRNMHKNKLDSILNFVGLSLGLACAILILYHIQDELGYDRHFPKSERIFRATCEMREGDNVRHWATTAPVLLEHMAQALPEIEKTCRLFVIPAQILSYIPENGAPIRLKESSGFFADQSSIDIFDFKFIDGNPQTALTEVSTIVLSKRTADKFFPGENPLGKVINFSSPNKAEKLLKITGVVENIPTNSHFDFSYLVSFPTFYVFLREIGQEQLAQMRTWAALYNYVLLKDKKSIIQTEAKLPDFAATFLGGMAPRDEILARIKYHLQPIVDIHLHSKLEQEFKANSDINTVYIFSAIAFLILLVAGVNFINISTTHALKRIREVGIRKVMGARKHQLIWQILSESFLSVFLAFCVSILLIHLFLPFYNTLAGKQCIFASLFTSAKAISFAMILLIFSLLACLYPAIFVSSFNPVQSLKGIRNPLSMAAKVRKGLVIFQFSISVFIIFSTIVAYRQMIYFKNKNLGFDKENVVAIQLNNDAQQIAIKNPETLKYELLRNPCIVSASVASDMPGGRLSVEHLRVDGAPPADQRVQFRFIRVDKDYPQVLNFKITDGRDFSNVSDNTSAFMINQRAAQALKIENPVGKIASSIFGGRGEIVGVANDFHFASLHNSIEPLVIEYLPRSHPMQSAFSVYLLVRIKGADIQKNVRAIETAMHKIAPGSLFVYSFIDQDLNRLYDAEERMSNLFKAFAVLAIFISCLGLFGLSSYSAQLRVKEVGIRKTLGASVASIVRMLSNRYLVWITIANFITLPLAWLYMSDWLRNFAYRIQINSWPFISTFFITLFVALVTTSYHALRAALANPVKSLRYE